MGWLKKDPGITGRLVLALTVASALVFVVVFIVNYQYTASMVERQVQAHARDVVTAAVQSIDDILLGVVRDENNLVAALEAAPAISARRVSEMAHNHVVTNDEVFGATISFEPGASPKSGKKLFAPYFYKRLNGSIAFADLATPTYNYPAKEWYTKPKLLKGPVWSDPYFDDGGGNVLMTTYSVPFYRLGKDGKRQFAGISTADISIDWLGRQISSLKLYNNGYASLFSSKGVYLAHHDRNLVLKETVFSVAERLANPVLKNIGHAIARQESGFVKGKNIYGTESWIYYAPVPSTGWSLAVVFPAEAMMADAYRSSRMIALFCAAGFAVLVITIVLVSRTVTRPLVAMTEAVGLIAEGRLDVPLPEKASGEVGHLVQAFGRMQHDLQGYIKSLTEATAAKERMASELAIGTQIQNSFLPSSLPQISSIKLAACCIPAREVGGDFYDIIDLGGNRLFFAIGDVSGKGVPAALYMAATVTLIRALAREQSPPAQLMQRLNNELARDNDSSMFVTILCGYIHTETGRIEYANAGHNPPVLKRNGEPAVYMALQPGLVAGCMESYQYEPGVEILAPGDMLLLYTDGVTEAQDSNGDFYGEDRLLEYVSSIPSDADQVAGSLRATLESFAGGAPQADDITLLAVVMG